MFSVFLRQDRSAVDGGMDAPYHPRPLVDTRADRHRFARSSRASTLESSRISVALSEQFDGYSHGQLPTGRAAFSQQALPAKMD